MGEDLLTQVGSDERWTRDGERSREITSVCVCLRVLGGLSEAGFAGFVGIFGMAGVLLGQVRSYECWTRDGERLTRDHERLRVFAFVGRIVWSRICRIYWDFQDGGGPADAGGLVRALDERWRALRDHERLRVFTSVGRIVCLHEMGEDLLTQVHEREILREIMFVYECWADCLKQDLQDFLGFSRWRGYR